MNDKLLDVFQTRETKTSLRTSTKERADKIDKAVCQPLEQHAQNLKRIAHSRELTMAGLGEPTQMGKDSALASEDSDFDKEFTESITKYYGDHPLRYATDFPVEKDPRYLIVASMYADHLARGLKRITSPLSNKKNGDGMLLISRDKNPRVALLTIPPNERVPIISNDDIRAGLEINRNLEESTRLDVVNMTLHFLGASSFNPDKTKGEKKLPILPESYDPKTLGTLVIKLHDKSSSISVLIPTRYDGLFVEYIFNDKDGKPEGPALQMGIIAIPPEISSSKKSKF